MKKILLIISLAILTACTSTVTRKPVVSTAQFINEIKVKSIIDTLRSGQPAAVSDLIEKGVKHAASLWRKEDGSESDFSEFVRKTSLQIRYKERLSLQRFAGILSH